MSPDATKVKTNIGQRISLAGYKLMCWILAITDVRLVALFGRALGYLVWALFPSRRSIVARNMRIVQGPALRPDKLNSLVRRNIVRTTMNLVCSLKTGLMSDREMERSISIVGKTEFELQGTNGHTAIGCVPHAGNWELLARIRPKFSKIENYNCMYRKLSNPLLEDYVYRSRTRYGCMMHSKEDGLKAVLQLARSGGLLGVLSDQFTQEGIYIPYFGKATGVTPLPALLYKRCKGKGTLNAVTTRNIALGKWEALMNHPIDIPEDCTSIEEITMHVNLALEKCQKENIIDGFWMHHRWKCTHVFAPQNAIYPELIRQYGTIPFRAIVCAPEEFAEAVLLIPALRVLKASRPDMQITMVCPTEQIAFWKKQQELVTYTVSTDSGEGVYRQLDSDEIYKDGPFDILFMFSSNKRVMKEISRVPDLFMATFADNPLTKKYRFRARYAQAAAKPVTRASEIAQAIAKNHRLAIPENAFTPAAGNNSATGTFIAPFSSLGTADSWPEANWKELVRKLGGATLLALPQDKEKAELLATSIGCELCICAPEDVCEHLGTGCTLYAVDGLLPQLAALAGCRCTVLMASRLPAVYEPAMGEGHRCLSNHTPCHPCYSSTCDRETPCISGISVDDVLNA